MAKCCTVSGIFLLLLLNCFCAKMFYSDQELLFMIYRNCYPLLCYFLCYNLKLFVSFVFAASTILPPKATAAQAFVY